MPKRKDIHKVMVIGNGPVVIGQAAEFDYSGTQACKALKDEGVEVVLVNSNPATIMTDTETADRVYVEPMDLPHLEKIIATERPDGLLPTLGGQTGLNLATELHTSGIAEKYDLEFLGTSAEAIYQLEKGGMRTILSKAIWAAYKKSRLLGERAQQPAEGPLQISGED